MRVFALSRDVNRDIGVKRVILKIIFLFLFQTIVMVIHVRITNLVLITMKTLDSYATVRTNSSAICVNLQVSVY